MLVSTLRAGTKITIGNDIEISLLHIRRNKALIGFKAPREMVIEWKKQPPKTPVLAPPETDQPVSDNALILEADTHTTAAEPFIASEEGDETASKTFPETSILLLSH